MSLMLYCGNCRKSVAEGSMDELKAVILSKPMVCSKCNKEVIKDELALFCEPAKNEVFVLKLVKKPAPAMSATKPVIKPNKIVEKKRN